MPVQVTFPGVYIQEVTSGVRTLTKEETYLHTRSRVVAPYHQPLRRDGATCASQL
jgi:hypothetical protein